MKIKSAADGCGDFLLTGLKKGMRAETRVPLKEALCIQCFEYLCSINVVRTIYSN